MQSLYDMFETALLWGLVVFAVGLMFYLARRQYRTMRRRRIHRRHRARRMRRRSEGSGEEHSGIQGQGHDS